MNGMASIGLQINTITMEGCNKRQPITPRTCPHLAENGTCERVRENRLLLLNKDGSRARVTLHGIIGRSTGNYGLQLNYAVALLSN